MEGWLDPVGPVVGDVAFFGYDEVKFVCPFDTCLNFVEARGIGLHHRGFRDGFRDFIAAGSLGTPSVLKFAGPDLGETVFALGLDGGCRDLLELAGLDELEIGWAAFVVEVGVEIGFGKGF